MSRTKSAVELLSQVMLLHSARWTAGLATPTPILTSSEGAGFISWDNGKSKTPLDGAITQQQIEDFQILANHFGVYQYVQAVSISKPEYDSDLHVQPGRVANRI